MLDELEAGGQLRRATRGTDALLDIRRALLEPGVTAADLLADSRRD